VFAPIGTIAVYCPVFYLPGAAGLWAAQRLGMFPYDAILAGRLCAALCFVAMGAAALHLARFGRVTMFCALACPMTLSLAASFNQDGLLIAASALAAALATRHARLGTMLLIGGIATVKLPYLPLAALLLLPGEPLRRRLARVLLVALPALAWTAIMLATVAAPVSARTDAVAQAHGLLADPARLIWLPATTIAHDPWLLRQAIGILGWLNLLLPDALYQAWMAALPCAVLADLLAPRQPNRVGRALLLPAAILAAILAAIWAIYFSQYLTWTAVGLDHIEGPTGRYFLPLVPLLGLALPTFGGWPRLRLLATAIPVLAAAAGLAVLPALVVGAYYLR
jgi:hypothetical protein